MHTLVLASALLTTSVSGLAQSSGSQGGVPLPHPAAVAGPDRETLERFITVEGRAELRVVPDRLRVVLAVTSEGESPKACRTTNAEQLGALAKALEGAGVDQKSITTDFIAMLPTYSWRVEDMAGQRVAVEKPTGYRLQENVHVATADESSAQKVIDLAFGVGISSVIAVDHWSSALDDARQQALDHALAAARRKAEVLLSVFESKPRPVNVSESTEIVRPEAMYVSFENAYEGTMTQPWSRDLPVVSAFRPKNTFLRGFVGDVDLQSGAVPMEPYIAVVSTVRIHYRTPDAGPLTVSDRR